ncbi:MAG TPA: alpha/beta fold hydrolase [Arachnia sp.]|nr:alpha/beta fold hydrolase [Arachnia sp.]HMT87819.1 alpha/beta fold hydrolase [Arachnia sp.]
MTEPQTFTYTDPHGVRIAAYRFAAAAPRAVVQIAHGVGEHARRYDHVAARLVEEGYTVYADDHRGHGETGRRQHDGDLSRLGRLGPGGLRATEDAVIQLTARIRAEQPGLPVAVLGHSWGSLMTQRILDRAPRTWDAVVLSGSAYRTPRHLNSGHFNKRWDAPGATGFEWLSREPAVAAAFAADELCFDADILALFGPADAFRLFGVPARGLSPEVPILITSGSEDPLALGDSLARLARAYQERGVRDVTLRTYPGARHEIVNETNRDEVIGDVIDWLNARLPRTLSNH